MYSKYHETKVLHLIKCVIIIRAAGYRAGYLLAGYLAGQGFPFYASQLHENLPECLYNSQYPEGEPGLRAGYLEFRLAIWLAK